MSEKYCGELIEEFGKLILNGEEKEYVKKAEISLIPYSYPGRDFERWKETDNAVFYRMPTEVYRITNNSLFMLGPSKITKINQNSEIKIWGKKGYFNHCF